MAFGPNNAFVWSIIRQNPFHRAVVPSRGVTSVVGCISPPTEFGSGRAGEREVKEAWERIASAWGKERRPSRVDESRVHFLYCSSLLVFDHYSFTGIQWIDLNRWFRKWSRNLPSLLHISPAHTCDVNSHLVKQVRVRRICKTSLAPKFPYTLRIYVITQSRCVGSLLVLYCSYKVITC